MIIPMVFMQLGIAMDYWGDFSDNAWSVHVHYWTGTIWYGFLIAQPYLATHGKLEQHRTYGIIGMFMAGAVTFTALSMMYRDIATTIRATEHPDVFGPFIPDFFFGVAAIEIPMILVFGYAVIMSILKRKQLEDHAWWLISTVFIIMMPALGRGIQNIWIIPQVENWPDVDILTPIYISQVLIVLLIVGAAWKYKKFKHPATYWAIGINIMAAFVMEIGKLKWVQEFLVTVIKN